MGFTPSRHLKILVTEEGRMVVSLELPARSVEMLGLLVPAKAKAKMEAKGMNFDQLVDRVKATDYAPQTLFEAQADTRSYKVWLE